MQDQSIVAARRCVVCGGTSALLEAGRATYCSYRCSNLGSPRRAPYRSPEERFWAKVNKEGPTPAHCPELGSCWIWLGNKLPRGYGNFSNDKARIYAHRFSWLLAHPGEVIPDRIYVLHRCDNPPCVRPSHLFLGTHLENVRDAVNKGRHPHGEGMKQSKANDTIVRELRARHAEGTATYDELAAETGLSKTTVFRIVKHQAWTHIT